MSSLSPEFRAVRSRLASATVANASPEELGRLRRHLALIRGRDRLRELPPDLTVAEREFVLDALHDREAGHEQ